MGTATQTQSGPLQNRAFSVLLCSTLGTVIFELWIFQLGAKPLAQLVTCASGAAIGTIMYRFFRPYWTDAATVEHHMQQKKQAQLIDAAGGFVFLLGAACVVGEVLRSGWLTAFYAVAIALGFMPWSKLALCRRHCLASLFIGAVGVVAFLLAAPRAHHPLLLPAGAWGLWMVAIIAWLRLIGLRQRSARR
jgi:hypothetical protein